MATSDEQRAAALKLVADFRDETKTTELDELLDRLEYGHITSDLCFDAASMIRRLVEACAAQQAPQERADARRQMVLDLWRSLPDHESIGSLRFTLEHGEFAVDIRALIDGKN